jgi:hypothetical protein
VSAVTAHSWEPNSDSGKPLFALAEKGVEFERVHTGGTE